MRRSIRDHVYACGPARYIENVLTAAERRGFLEESRHFANGTGEGGHPSSPLSGSASVTCVIRRGKLALTQFWWMSGLCGANDARLKEIELPAAIHLAFYELRLGDLPLCLAV